MNVEYYTGVDERLPVPIMLPPTPEFIDLEDARILVADDVADTGHTLALVHQFCQGKVADVRAAVLYQKPQSVIDCDYVWRRTSAWISFPWSADLPVVGSGRADGAALSLGADAGPSGGFGDGFALHPHVAVARTASSRGVAPMPKVWVKAELSSTKGRSNWS